MKNLYYLFILSFLLISCEEEVPPKTYTLTTQVTPAGAGTVNPSSGTYDEGESVTISATPSANFIFKQWTGTGSGTANPLTFKIISNTIITAEFELIDADGDGVTDALDKCPDTPAGSTVNAEGCTTSQLDTDGDGVSDDKDKCPDTPDGADVNENGCQFFTLTIKVSPEIGGTVFPSSGNYEVGTQVSVYATPSDYYVFDKWDEDGNGVSANPLEITINSNLTLKAIFSIVDSDSDGVTDELDNCPDTPSGEVADENGCSLSQRDTDGDGVTDDIDQCPDTPSDEVADENGCSDSQKDTDGDGVTDDKDQCPNTPENTDINEDGCPYIFLAENGVTLIANDFAEINKTYSFNSIEYLIVDRDGLKSAFDANKDLSKVITTFVQSNNNGGIYNVFISNNRDRTEFNDDISTWDVRGITNMSDMFNGHHKFNQNIGYWDVSNVTDMHYMFWGAVSFNQDISNWDVSSVDGSQGAGFSESAMDFMFRNASSFNQDLSSWNVVKCNSCMGFKQGATNYTLPIPNFTNCNPN